MIAAAVTVQPASSLSALTSTWTDSAVGGVPAFASSLEQAIEKHDAWAAASSSSGDVTPAGSPVRDAHVVGRSWKTPVVAAVTVPRPDSRSPLQVAIARRVVAIWILPVGLVRVVRTIVPQLRRQVRCGRGWSGSE